VGILADWILRRVVKSALVFEAGSLDTYRRLRERLVDHPLWESLSHLLEEEEHHWRILADAAEGRLNAAEMERIVAGHVFSGLARLRPLEGEAMREWGPELERALEEEERTLLFYGNLRRMSRIPVVRRAFEVLAAMEREHVDILRRLLGRSPAASSAALGGGPRRPSAGPRRQSAGPHGQSAGPHVPADRPPDVDSTPSGE
jgi:rubrerythrin